MEESLRSGSISGKPDGRVMPMPENKVNDEKKNCFDLNDEINPKMDSGSDSVKEILETKETDGPVNDECGETGLDENEKKRSRVDGEENGNDAVVNKRMKENCEVKNVGRILRSRLRLKSGSEKESNEVELERKDRNRGIDGSENARDVHEQMEVSNEANDAEGRKKVKGKRGRPPKVHESDESEGKERKKSKVKHAGQPKLNQIDESYKQERIKAKYKRGRHRNKAQDSHESDDEGSKRLRSKRGRPCKDTSDDVGSKRLKKKRGRPPKVLGSNVGLKGKLGKGRKLNGFRSSRRDSLRNGLKLDVPTHSSFLENGHTGKELNIQRLVPTKEIKCADTKVEVSEAMLSPTLKTVNQSEKKDVETKQEETLAKSKAKQLLRDRIVKLLLGAGWKIQYRPRFGREYSDAVYVNPEGKTHWSVTLAYRMLKEHYEERGGNSESGKTGFTFTPIPEDELNILKKVINKTRSDKVNNKLKKKRKDVGTEGAVITKKKKNKGKVNSAASPGSKPLKGGIKRKLSFSEHCNSVGTSQKGMSIPARKRKQQETHNRKRCGLLVRNSVEGAESDGDGFVAYDGKRTVLAWMIDMGTVPLDAEVQYWNRRKTRVMLKGRITRDGICCDCCGEIFVISKFEAHSKSKLCHPFQNLYLESGSSLLQCILDSWNKQDESKCKGFHFVDFGGEDPNDDTCGICGDGGDLICCDGCPSTFHQSCLDIKKFPSGKWHCVYCSCKFCGSIDENTCHMTGNSNSDVSMIQICSLCEEKYHQSCSQAEGAVKYEARGSSFCGKKCQEIFERLRVLLGVKHELEEGYTWSLIHRSDVGSDLFLSDVCQKVECNAKLAVALFVMDECFLPLADHRSSINLIHNIVYNFGSNFKRLNYSGFLTAILERDDEIIAAASIRIHGKELAEMPFIGTRHMYRRQGMCRRLLSGIESALCSLNVEKLVIPAISELRDTWTSVFGFKPLEVSSKQKMRNISLLVFPGVDMLQKPMLKNQFPEENMISAEGLKSSELEKPLAIDEVGKNSHEKCSDGIDLNVCSEVTAPHECKIHDESAAVESTLQFPNGSSHDISGPTNEAVHFPRSATGSNGIYQLGVTPDELQGNDKTAMNPLGSMFDAADDISDCGGRFSHALRPAVKSVTSEAKIENSSVKQNLNSCDEASAHKSAEHQNLDFSLGLKASSEHVFTHDSVTVCQMSHDADVIKDQDPQQLQVVECLLEYGERKLETQEVKSGLAFSENMSIASGDVNQASPESSGTHILCKPSNTSCCSVDNASQSATQRVQNVENCFCDVLSIDSNVSSSCQANGFDTHEMVVSPSNTDCHPPFGPFSETPRKHDFLPCTSNEVCLSTDETTMCNATVDYTPDPEEKFVSPNAFQSESSEHPKSDSSVHHAGVTNCNTEPVCNSSPGLGVALHCASGGGNSCGTSEVMILSNQAEIVVSSTNTDCHPPCGPFSNALGKSDFPPCTSNEVCLSTDKTTACKSTVDNAPDPGEKFASPNGFQSESSEHPRSNSPVHHTGVTNCNVEPVCNSSPGSGVALHCASGGGNSCSTAEVIILSNQAS